MKSPKQLLVFGDSGVYGWGDKESGGWCNKLKIEFMNMPNGPIVYPLGIRGDGLEKINKRWENEFNCRGELRRKFPEGVLLSIGLNDLAKVGRIDGRPQLSKEAFRFGFEKLLNSIKQKTSVMVLGLTPVDEFAMPFAECLWYSNKESELYESQIEESCLETDVPFLSLHKEMCSEKDWKNFLEPDGIHLNTYGHQWVFKRVISWKTLLRWTGIEFRLTATPL